MERRYEEGDTLVKQRNFAWRLHHDEDSAALFWPVMAIFVCGAIIANAYSYILATSIPLPQSDAWRFIGGFLRKYIEGDLTFLDFFAQGRVGDTNQPLQKLILIFHTRFYDMDFSVEGVIGIVAAIFLYASLLLFAIRDRGGRKFGLAEAVLATFLALVVFSLNSTNIYSWGLVTLWFLPILLTVLFIGFVTEHDVARRWLVVAGALLGLLIDEVAFLGFCAALGGIAVARSGLRAGALRDTAVFAGLGLVLSKVFYWICGLAAGMDNSQALPMPLGDALSPLFRLDVIQAIYIPLANSVILPPNLKLMAGASSHGVSIVVASSLAIAHVWFWWTAFRDRRALEMAPLLTALAVAIQLLFYALVAGIVIQRVPQFGFDYLHQGRYVLFYQLNLVAICLLVYRQYTCHPSDPVLRVSPMIAVLLFMALQVVLSQFAWSHSKSVSRYVQAAAFTMGKLAQDPSTEIECASILTICRYPVQERQELMTMLKDRRYNLFSPRFQFGHRLYPDLESIPK